MYCKAKQVTMSLQDLEHIFCLKYKELGRLGNSNHERDKIQQEIKQKIKGRNLSTIYDSISGEEQNVYDLEAHIKFIEQMVDNCDLQKNVTIKRKFHDRKVLSSDRGRGVNPPIHYELKIESLALDFESNFSFTLPFQVPANRIFIEDASGQFAVQPRMEVKFVNCRFSDRSGSERTKGITIEAGENCLLRFQKCKFEKISLVSQCADNDSSIILKNNRFEGGKLQLSGFIKDGTVRYLNGDAGYELINRSYANQSHRLRADMMANRDYYNLVGRIENKIGKRYSPVKNNQIAIVAQLILQYLIERDRKEPKEQAKGASVGSNSKTTLISNIIPELTIKGDVNCLMQSGNKIGRFSLLMFSSLYFSANQEIGKSPDEVIAHRNTFLRLQHYSAERNDGLQEATFKREIIKCEHALLSGQEFSRIWQDWLVFWWGELTSKHGISWVRPLGFILALNFLVAALFVFCISVNSGFWVTVFDLFDPTYSLPHLDENNRTVGISALNGLHKTLYFLLIYETIRAARRFAR